MICHLLHFDFVRVLSAQGDDRSAHFIGDRIAKRTVLNAGHFASLGQSQIL
jgi:hypothetical protein